jgi:hypothetical protein
VKGDLFELVFGSEVEEEAASFKVGAGFARDLERACVFPKADTAFPKMRSAERQVEGRSANVLRLA